MASGAAAATVTAYRVVQPRIRRSVGAVLGVIDGLWLGLLSQAQLDTLDAGVYDSAPKYADDAYNAGGLHAWERHALDAHFTAGSRVVVTGAGGGREVLALLTAGYDAVGYECNRTLAAYGGRFLATHGHRDRLRWSARHRWPTDAGRCDGVVVGWGSYTHIPGRSRRVRFLSDARAMLPDGGPIMLSFWTVPSWTPYLRAVQVTGSAVRRLRRRPGLDDGDALVGSYVHHFTRGQVVDELSAAGFSLAHYRDVEYGVAVGTADRRAA